MRNKLLLPLLLVFIVLLSGCDFNIVLPTYTPKTNTNSGGSKTASCEHEYVLGDVLKEATCEEAGLRKVICAKCGKEFPERFVTLDKKEHNFEIRVTKAATCSAKGSGIKYCTMCKKEFGEVEIDQLEHTLVYKDKVDSTCTEVGHSASSYCSVCGAEFGETIIPALGHDYEYKKTISGEDVHTTDEYECSRCHAKTYNNPITNYHIAYGYQYLTDPANYPTMYNSYQALYEALYNASLAFYNSEEDYLAQDVNNDGEPDGVYKLIEYNCTENEISIEEAAAVYHTFFYECTEFYFLPSGYNQLTMTRTLGDEVTITKFFLIYIEEQFLEYERREEINNALKDMCNDLSEVVDTKSDEYVALSIHDFIAGRIDYLWVRVGEYITPADTIEAHSIIGCATKEGGVCESYAKTFLYLSRIYGLNSILVHGNAGGGGHAWNYVEVDDKWYAMDVTWDDQEERIYHLYFMDNFADFNKNNGGEQSDPESYIHIPSESNINSGLDYQYALPTLSLYSAEYNEISGVITLK